MSLVYLFPQFAVRLMIFMDLILFFKCFWHWPICSLSGVTCEHLLAQSFYKFAAPGEGGKTAQLEVLMRAALTVCKTYACSRICVNLLQGA